MSSKDQKAAEQSFQLKSNHLGFESIVSLFSFEDLEKQYNVGLENDTLGALVMGVGSRGETDIKIL